MPPDPMDRPIAVAAAMLDRGLRRRLASDLRGAIGRGELALHYQPRLGLPDGARTGVEALLRWRHAERGDVPPAAFIPLAEGSDLIIALGGWVLRQAARDAAGHPGLGRVSVNVSGRQLLAGALPGQVDAALGESGLPPDRLELELTETLALPEDAGLVATLRRLRDRGIGLALDDFGAGYAGYARLARLPFTTLKLDHSLLARVPEGAADMAILRAIHGMGRALGLRLAAEGVERPEQWDALVELGFDEAQGYLLGAPAPLDALAATVPPAVPPPLAARPLAAGR